MTDKELMQQALEALDGTEALLTSMDVQHLLLYGEVDKAITALRERLALPEMQPCAGRNCGSTNPNLHSAECFEDYEKATGMNQRKPLSEKEIQTYRHMIDWTAEWSYIEFARAIEAAHGIGEKPDAA